MASASSAAIGAGAVQAFVQNVIEFVRKYARDTMAGPVSMLSCSIYRMLIENLVGPCNRNAVIDEFHKVLGCTTEHDQQNNVVEDSAITAKRWVGFLQKMAIQMTVSGPLGNDHKGHMAVDAVIAMHNLHGHIPKLNEHTEYPETMRYAKTRTEMRMPVSLVRAQEDNNNKRQTRNNVHSTPVSC